MSAPVEPTLAEEPGPQPPDEAPVGAAVKDLPLTFELLPIPGTPYVGLRVVTVVNGQCLEAVATQFQFQPQRGADKAIALELNPSSAASLSRAMRSGQVMSASDILEALQQHLDSTARLVGLAKEAA